jgi:hypothetical protein
VTITTTIAAVNAAIVAEVAAATSSVGSRVADDHGSPPRVRWIPTGDEPGAAPKFSPLASGLQRALVGLSTTFDVECWGEDFEAAVTLRDALVRALHSAVGTQAFALAGGPWARGDALTLGEAVTLRVTLRAYVPETAPTVATVTAVAFDTTGATVGDGVIFVPSDGT